MLCACSWVGLHWRCVLPLEGGVIVSASFVAIMSLLQSKVMDIEELAVLGKAHGACPYYATRKAVEDAEVCAVPSVPTVVDGGGTPRRETPIVAHPVLLLLRCPFFSCTRCL